MAVKKKAEIMKELEEALQKITELETEIEELKKVVQKHNERNNTGRPRKFGDSEKATITMLFLQGKSYRTIAKEVGCSLGFVHKVLNEHPKSE